jgi:hypothetical protein
MSRVIRFLVAALVIGALSASAVGCQGFASGWGAGPGGIGGGIVKWKG